MTAVTETLESQFFRNDVLYGFVHEKLGATITHIMLAIALIMGTVQGTLFIVVGTPSAKLAITQIIFQSFLVVPLGILLYFLIPGFLAKPFIQMQNAESVDSKQGVSYDLFIDKVKTSISSAVWVILAIVCVCLYWAYRLFAQVPSDLTSQIESPVIRLGIRMALLIIYSLPFYMVILTICRTLVGLIFIGRLFRSYKVTIDPINPDDAGGIGYVGEMLVTSVLIATAFGAAAIGLAYTTIANGSLAGSLNMFERPEVLLLSSIYLILTPLLFYSLLWSPHKALLHARDEILKPLADEFQRESSESIPLGKNKARALKSKTDRLYEIKRQYELIRESFPEWPLDTNSLRNLVTTSILPLITTVFSGPLNRLWEAIIAFLKAGKP